MYTAKPIIHRGQARIAVNFERKPELIARFKALEGAKWSATLKTWHLPDTPAYRQMFKLTPLVATSAPTPGKTERPEIIKFTQWLNSKRYSSNTIKTYTEALGIFLHYFTDKPLTEISNDDVIDFNNQYILGRGLSASYQNQMVNAIKLFFSTTQHRQLDLERVHRPKRPKTLPNVLSKQEVKLILDAHANIKHKVMLSLIYACGLRRSELIALKPNHVDSKRELLLIKQAKGRKDRIVPLPNKIVEMLRKYYKSYKPKMWLFEGQEPGRPYTAESLQQVLKQALIKAKINKPVSLHWLRHSYATHLLENGTDLRYIQELLGHNSSRTTEIYTHVSTQNIKNIKSPFDEL